MAHGYMREFDEDRGDERDRWRDEDRERGWRGNERDWNERGNQRNRDFMLGDRDRSWERSGGRDDDRGFFDRMGDRARSAFGDDRERQDRDRGMSHYGREHGYGGFQGDYGPSGRNQGGFGGRGDWERAPRGFRSRQDDHYQSWRDRQMDALDRDYADYCREREQQFHQDFDQWRQNRQSNRQPLQTGMTQTGTSEPVMELNQPAEGTTSPTGEATLGTNSDPNEGTARGRAKSTV